MAGRRAGRGFLLKPGRPLYRKTLARTLRLLLRTNLITNPSATASTSGYGISAGVGGVAAITRPLTGGRNNGPYARATWSTAQTGTPGNAGFFITPRPSASPGEYVSGRVWVRSSITQRITLYLQYLSATFVDLLSTNSAPVVLVADTWTELTLPQASAAPAGTTQIQTLFYAINGTGAQLWPIGATLDFDEVMVTKGLPFALGPYFDGSSSASADATYAWTGTADASTSTESGSVLAIPAATATASAPPPKIPLLLAAPAAHATVSAPAPGLTLGGFAFHVPPATATATATPPALTLGAYHVPAATATASAPPPKIPLLLAAPAAHATVSAPVPFLSMALVGWTADQSQRTLLDIVSTTGELDYTPPLMLPPAGMVERPIVRDSIILDPADVVIDANGRARAPAGSYTVVGGTVGVPHLLIGGRDVTYYRGVPAGLGRDRQEGPFGDCTLSLDLPWLTPFDNPGAGALAWLKAGAPVEIILKNGAVTKHVWAGHLVSDDGGNDEHAARTTWAASGALWQASTFGHRVPTIMDPTDIGTVIARSLNGVVARRYPSLRAPATGINTMARGSSDDSEMAYVQSLLATAWTSSTQWTVAKRVNTARTYDIKLKDVATVHHTVTVGAPGVDVTLSRDLTSTANALFGRGIAPSGFAWAGWCYPNFMADDAPAYPYASGATVMSIGDSDGGTLTGDGVSAWQRRVNELNLTGNVGVDGVYNSGDAAVCRGIQHAYGLLVDGIVGPQTWDATFAVGSSGGDLTGAYRRPLAIDPATEPNLYTPTGAIAGPNPAYAGAMRWERDTDYGPGVTKAEATASAVLELARDKDPALTGTITLTTDPREGSRFYATPGQNIQALGYNGTNPVLHVAAVDRDWAALTVTLAVDEHARDAITWAAIRGRDKEAMLDPARRPGRTNRRSRQDQDQIVPFDGESDGGIIPRHAIYGGLWTVIHIPLSEAGQVAKLDVRSQSPAAPFCMAFFAGPVTPAHLVRLVGDPLSGTNPFGRTEAAADALDDLGLIEALGGPGSAAGYWPGQEGSGSLTGRLKDTGGFTYNSVKGGWVWVAEWSPTSTFISGRIYPAPIQ